MDEICNQKDGLTRSHILLSFPERNHILRRNPSFMCLLHHHIAGLEKLVNVILRLIDVPEHQP
jgi:hypothetical protein